MPASGPDPQGNFGQARHIVDRQTGDSAAVVAGALKVTGVAGGSGGTVDQGVPNTPANAWPVKPTDAAGVNQQAITAAGDAKITLDGEQVDVSDRTTRDNGAVRINNGTGASAVNIRDGSNSITVDAPVGTPVAVRQSDGVAFIAPTLASQLPAALGPTGGLQIEGISGGVGVVVQQATANNLKANVSGSSVTAFVSNIAASDAVPARLSDGAAFLTTPGGRLAVDASGVAVPITAASLPLPTGAATETKQDTGNLSLSSLDSKIGTLESKPSAYSVLDRLYQLGLKLDAINKAQAIEADLLRKIPPPAPAQSVLLLRHPLRRV